MLSSSASSGSTPLALFMIGSMERGNKVFRYQSFEALQLHGQLQAAGLAESVPIAGLFSLGSFARLKSWDVSNSNTTPSGTAGSGEGGLAGAQCALMEADSVYAFLAKQPTKVSPPFVTATRIYPLTPSPCPACLQPTKVTTPLQAICCYTPYTIYYIPSN